MDCRAIADNASQKFLSYTDSSDGWQLSSKSTSPAESSVPYSLEGVCVHFKPSDLLKGGYIYRGRFYVKCSLEEVFDFMTVYDNCPRQEWDSNISGFRVVETIDEDTRVHWSSSKGAAFGIISPRDLVQVAKVTRSKNCIYECGQSVESPACPLDKSYVRAITYPCGFKIATVPEAPEFCQVTIIFHVDLKGMIPKAFMHTAFQSLIVSTEQSIKKFIIPKGLVNN